MSDETKQFLFAAALPFGLSACVVAGLWLWQRGSRRGAGERLAAWAVPSVAAVCVLTSYLAQMRDRSGRWQWLVPAMIAVPLVWALLLTILPRRRVEPAAEARPAGKSILTALLAAAVLSAVAGGMAAMTVYPTQPAAYRFVAAAAVFALTLVLFPLTATAADALAVAVAGFVTAAVVVLGQFLGAAELLAPACVGAGVAGAGSLLFRDNPARRGLLAGALAAGVLLPVAALVGWLNSYDLETPLAWAFVLPAAGLPLLWLARLPFARRRPKTAAAVAFLLAVTPAAVGFSLAVLNTDLRPFGVDVNNAPGAGDDAQADDYSAYY